MKQSRHIPESTQGTNHTQNPDFRLLCMISNPNSAEITSNRGGCYRKKWVNSKISNNHDIFPNLPKEQIIHKTPIFDFCVWFQIPIPPKLPVIEVAVIAKSE